MLYGNCQIRLSLQLNNLTTDTKTKIRNNQLGLKEEKSNGDEKVSHKAKKAKNVFEAMGNAARKASQSAAYWLFDKNGKIDPVHAAQTVMLTTAIYFLRGISIRSDLFFLAPRRFQEIDPETRETRTKTLDPMKNLWIRGKHALAIKLLIESASQEDLTTATSFEDLLSKVPHKTRQTANELFSFEKHEQIPSAQTDGSSVENHENIDDVSKSTEENTTLLTAKDHKDTYKESMLQSMIYRRLANISVGDTNDRFIDDLQDSADNNEELGLIRSLASIAILVYRSQLINNKVKVFVIVNLEPT